MNKDIQRIQSHLTEAGDVLYAAVELSELIAEVANAATKSLRNGGTIFWCGNGGSAADSQHFAAELIGRYKQERKALSSLALTTDSSILTAISNDFGFEQVFSRQLEGLAHPGDILIAITTSGSSKSILEVIEKAKTLNVITVMLTSLKYKGNAPDYVLKIPSIKTEQIQHAHSAVGHIICELVETKMFTKED